MPLSTGSARFSVLFLLLFGLLATVVDGRAHAGERPSNRKAGNEKGESDAKGEGEEKAEAGPPEHLEIRRWACRYDADAGAWTGAVRIRNMGKRPIDIIAVRIELDDREASGLGRTRWIRLGEKEIPFKKQAETAFRLEAPEAIGVLWVRFRYYFAPEAGGSTAVARRKLDEALTEGIDTSLLDTVEEVFFTLDPDQGPRRYSEEALAEAVAAINRQAGEDEAVRAGVLTFLTLKRKPAPGGKTQLALAIRNTLEPLAAGQLRVQIQLKDGGGKTIHTIDQHVQEAVPLGESVVRLPDPGIDFFGWEVAYGY